MPKNNIKLNLKAEALSHCAIRNLNVDFSFK